MRRVAFLAGNNLIEKTTQLATDVEPWADRVDCHITDFRRAGGRGEAMKIPIPKTRFASSATFPWKTHPLSPERLDELAADMQAHTHFVMLVPGLDLPEGQISRSVADAPVSRGPDSPGCWKCKSPGCAHAFFCSCACHGPADGPFPPPCFELGAQWYSFDNGLTWTRNPEARDQRLDSQRTGTMTVSGINRDRGEITIKVTPRR